MYQLVSKSNIATDDFLEVILGNRGIKDKDRFLEPKASDEIHYSNLHNIKEAVILFRDIESKRHLEGRHAHIVLIIDSDIDGNTSSAILASYIEENFEHITLHFLFHEGKQHGITDEKVKEVIALNKEVGVDLLIVADAGSSDYKSQHKLAIDNEIPILILDHHECEKGESEFALVVNNQISPEYSNKALSGVGIVYKFLQALDDEYLLMDADNYLDLVALGNISDSMDLTSPETRYLVYEGLRNIKNKFLREIIEKLIGDFKRVYPRTLAFGVIPKMNGVIRVGTPEEKIDLFNAFRGVEEVFYNERSKKNESLPQKMARVSVNAHSRQKTQRKKWMENFDKTIEENNLNENAFILIEVKQDEKTKVKDKFNRDLSGLLAGNLAGAYRKPTLILIWDEKKEAYTGSLRGYDGTMKNTKDFLTELELFDYLGGHQNACGFRIKQESLFSLNESINKALEGKELTGEQKHDVDFYLEDSQFNTSTVEEVFVSEYLWGKGADIPMFAIDVEVDTKNIITSKSSSMIKWKHNGIDIVQFSGDRRLLDLIQDGHFVKLTLVGSLSVNFFNNARTPQFMIEDMAIGEIIAEAKEIKEEMVDDLDDLFNW